MTTSAGAASTIGILGTGWVGASVAISVLHGGVANELLLCDLKADLAEGEAMDLAQGASFYPTARVRAVPFDELLRADAIVLSAGRGGKPEESRLDLLRDNARTMRAIGARLDGYAGLVVVVTNPVDVLTSVVAESSGIDPARVIGTGTMLDTARLRQAIGEELRIDPHSVHAYVVGEHGDSEVVLWSTAQVGGRPLRQWPGWSRAHETRIADRVRRAAYEIIRRKGATNHAIGLVTAALLKSALRGERRILTVSRRQSESRFDGVALSLPSIVDTSGACEVVLPELASDELDALERSAGVLREALRTVE